MFTTAQVETERLGQELVRGGMVRPEDFVEAIRLQKQQGRPIKDVLMGMGLASARDVLSAMGAVLGIPVVDLKRERIDPVALKYIPEPLARRHMAVPVSLHGGTLRVAMAEPRNLQALEDLSAQSGVTIEAALGDPAQIADAIDLHYKATSEIANLLAMDVRSRAETATQATVTQDVLVQTPVVRTLDLLLLQAVRDGASDVHVEPQQDRLRVRYRVDGVLKDVVSLPMSIHAPLVSRIKILAQMNIAERRLPQDGQFTFRSVDAADRDVAIRVATIETAHGERVVMRLLHKGTSLLSLQQLGFLPEAMGQYEEMLKAPHGMILVSGPTGSGKTTSLYASVNVMDRQSTNIVTIEDPIEYRFGDINQIQVNAKAGLTFSGGLRALMRHDPDVILVGEVRDADTAQTAIQAALTGHLVLSSIHANDTEGVIYRLINLGVDPFLIASALVGVVAQRMVRRVCPNCATTREASVEERFAYKRETGEDRAEFSYGKGCQFCSGTGYRGRTGIFEIMRMTEDLRRLVLANAEPGNIRQQALKGGVTSLLRDGLAKAAMGITTPMEAIRNLYW